MLSERAGTHGVEGEQLTTSVELVLDPGGVVTRA